MEKKNRISILVIIITAIIVILSLIFNPMYYLSQAFGSLEEGEKHVTTTIMIAVIAGSLFATRNRVRKEFIEQFEAMELLLLIVIPGVTIYSYIINYHEDYISAIASYVASVMVWVGIVFSKHKPIEDIKSERGFTRITLYTSAMLLSFALFAFWLYKLFNP